MANLCVFQESADLLLIGRGDILPDAPDRKVRGELAVFRCVTQTGGSRLEGMLQIGEGDRSVETDPQNARTP
jgi:hypothetical protein